jgi:hypothetical protein
MKKLVAFAAALSLASSTIFVLPSVASAATGNGNNTVAQGCQVAAATYGVSEGNCVQIVNAYLAGGNTTNANAICHLLQSGGFFPWPSFGACTSFWNAYYGKS